MNQDETLKFLLSWALNGICILLVAGLLPKNFGLGNVNIPGTMVAVSAAFVFTLVIFFVPAIIKKLDLKIRDMRVTIAFTMAALVPVIWIYKKLTIVTAFGVSNNFFILILAILLPIVQYFAYKYASKFLNKI